MKFFWTALLLSCNGFASYPIIFVIATPRTGSTSFVRFFDETNQVTTFNEPFLLPYLMETSPITAQHMFGNQTSTFENTMDLINQEAKKRPVFIKDMMFSGGEFLLKNSQIISQDNVHILFLVRDIYSMLRSYIKIPDEDARALYSLFDFDRLSALYKKVHTLSKNPTKIIQIEDFTANIKTRAPELFELIGIDKQWINYAFPDRNQQEIQHRFHDPKLPAIFNIWHQNAASRGSISPMPISTPEADGGTSDAPFSWYQDRSRAKSFEELLKRTTSSYKNFLNNSICGAIFKN